MGRQFAGLPMLIGSSRPLSVRQRPPRCGIRFAPNATQASNQVKC
jgi:hypothetical protein